MVERWGVVADIHGDLTFREGAKVCVRVVSEDRAEVWGLSNRGRSIAQDVALKCLSNFRAAMSLYPDRDFAIYKTKKEAEKQAKHYAQGGSEKRRF